MFANVILYFFLYFTTDNYVTAVLPEQDSSTVNWKLHNVLSITVSSDLLQKLRFAWPCPTPSGLQ